MTLKQLTKHYPTIPASIIYVEWIFCGTDQDCPQSPWELMLQPIKGQPVNPKQAVGFIRDCIQCEIKHKYGAIKPSVLGQLLKEMETPEFLSYIKGKMGAM